MITQSKLTNRPDNKLTKSFKPVELDDDCDEMSLKTAKNKKTKRSKAKGSRRVKNKRTGKNKKWMRPVMLPVLMLIVGAVTFGVIYLINPGRHDETADAGEDILGNIESTEEADEVLENEAEETEELTTPTDIDEGTASIQPITEAPSSNPTVMYGRLMLINPNFKVETDFINARRGELISLHTTYGILEMNAGNGDNLLDPEAAKYINKMLADYTIANPGHAMQTVSCFRSVGTNCGRLCAATGESDHHTGLTCDLIDPAYGTSLDTDDYEKHVEWKWLKENSYKYGFIDRFPEAWAGGTMAEPLNVNAEGTTGLYETWHYRYVGVYAATEIALGTYNNGEYDSLEHYLLARNLVTNLLNN